MVKEALKVKNNTAIIKKYHIAIETFYRWMRSYKDELAVNDGSNFIEIKSQIKDEKESFLTMYVNNYEFKIKKEDIKILLEAIK